MNRATAALLIGVVGVSGGVFFASRVGAQRAEKRRIATLASAWQDYETCALGGPLDDDETVAERTARLRVATSNIDPNRTDEWLRRCEFDGYADRLQKAMRGVRGAEELQPTYSNTDDYVLERQYVAARKLGLPMAKSPRVAAPALLPRRPLPIHALPFHPFDQNAIMTERQHQRAYFLRRLSRDAGLEAKVRGCSFKDGSCTEAVPIAPFGFQVIANGATPELLAFPTPSGELLDAAGAPLVQWKPVFPYPPEHFVHSAHSIDAAMSEVAFVRWFDGKVKAQIPIRGRFWIFDEWAVAERDSWFEIWPLPSDGSLPPAATRRAEAVAEFAAVGSPLGSSSTCDSPTSSAIVIRTPTALAVLARTGSQWRRDDVIVSKPAKGPFAGQDYVVAPRLELPVLHCGDHRVTVLARNGDAATTLSVDGIECVASGCTRLKASVTGRSSQSQPRELAFLGDDAVVATSSADGLVVRRGNLNALGNAKEELVVFSPGLAQTAWPWLLQDGADVLVFLFPFDDSRTSMRGVVLRPDGTFAPMKPAAPLD